MVDVERGTTLFDLLAAVALRGTDASAGRSADRFVLDVLNLGAGTASATSTWVGAVTLECLLVFDMRFDTT